MMERQTVHVSHDRPIRKPFGDCKTARPRGRPAMAKLVDIDEEWFLSKKERDEIHRRHEIQGREPRGKNQVHERCTQAPDRVDV